MYGISFSLSCVFHSTNPKHDVCTINFAWFLIHTEWNSEFLVLLFNNLSDCVLLSTQVDSDARKQWDLYATKLETIDADHHTGSEVVHWIMKYPVSWFINVVYHYVVCRSISYYISQKHSCLGA